MFKTSLPQTPITLLRAFWHSIRRQPLSYIVMVLVSIFFVAQPLKKSYTADVSVLLWALGLFALLSGKVSVRELAPYRKTIFAGFAFFLVAVLSILQSDYTSDLKILEPELRLMLFPLAIVGVYFSGLSVRQLIFALFLGSISYAWVTYEQSGGFHLIRRAAGDENPVGFGNGAFLLAVTMAYFAVRNRSHNKVLTVAAIAAGIAYLYASIASGTRGSLLAIPFIIGYLVLHFRSLKTISLGVVACLILSTIIYNSPLNNGINRAFKNIQDYLEDKGNNMNSTGLRLKQWETALCITAEMPLLGAGAHQFREATKDPQLNCDFNSGKHKIYFTQAHSLYFNTMATMGLAGLFSIIMFGVFACRESMALSESPIRQIVTLMVLTIAGYSLTVDAFFIHFIADKHLTLLAIALGLLLSTRLRADSEPGYQNPS